MIATLADETTPAAPRPVLYRPDSAVFWLFVAALVVGILGLLGDFGPAISDTLNTQLALAPVWLGFIAFLLWLILKFDPYRSVRRYPQGLVAGAALGATTAMVLAMYGNDAMAELWSRVLDPDTLAAWAPALTAPIIEECAKGLCATVILVLCAAVYNRIAHALMVGMFVGFGFDISEDLAYATSSAISSLDSDLAGAGENLVARILTAIPAHWAYTGLFAVGVLLLLPSFAGREHWTRGRRLAVATALMFGAVFMHFIWNAPEPDSVLTKFAINLAIFFTAALLLIRDERDRVRRRIAEGRHTEPLRGVDGEVLDSLGSWRARRRFRRQARRSGGRKAKNAARHRQNEALSLISQ